MSPFWFNPESLRAGWLVVVALLFLGVGLALLFHGWHIYRFSLGMLAALVGGLIGAAVASRYGVNAFVGALPGGLLLGLLSPIIEKVVVFLAVGLLAVVLIFGGQPGPAATTGMAALRIVAFLLGGTVGVLSWRAMFGFYLTFIGWMAVASSALLVLEIPWPGVCHIVSVRRRAWFLASLLVLTILWVVSRSRGEDERAPAAKEEEA